MYFKDAHGAWLSKAAGSDFESPADPDFAGMHDPQKKAPAGRWLTLIEVREANGLGAPGKQ
ncbi:MAG TPA: hypothetical protein VEO95_12735 [Chthoniobacteraceae bacterium]|nr:hypothetical protein [Chthoniobacteraceae bacterium]